MRNLHSRMLKVIKSIIWNVTKNKFQRENCSQKAIFTDVYLATLCFLGNFGVKRQKRLFSLVIIVLLSRRSVVS